MKKLILSAGLVMLSFASFAQDDFKEDLTTLIKAQSGAAIDANMQQVYNMIPEANREAFKKEMSAEMDKMYEKTLNIYIETIEKDDIKKMLEFYETPAGARILEKTPTLMTKSTEMSQKWAMESIMPIVQKYMN
ncbi:DUF2059 domain-containing protein [Mesonia sp. MT50]|uniref:DUF2059 domain-containing protein n=1 Tax=Mesonia profundi TaxID=3070998 RepID=A0ABU0ZY46_9FLAO|nr:DUF2059 domain-containing protein [Mesonia profundi]MDQ7916387.1 DUF2059 domain-containing protein [Mesonia profundi]